MEVSERLPGLAVGQLGHFDLRKGYYVYVGSALQGLRARLARHGRKGDKRMHWHIDYLVERVHISWILVWPTGRKLECHLSQSVKALSDNALDGFGCSDCDCDSHLYFFRSNPRNRLRGLHLKVSDGKAVGPRRIKLETGQ